MNTCQICNKKPLVGNSITRSGIAKKSGGIGMNITGINRRRFMPNLQKVKAILPSGETKRILVCTSCIKAGKVNKAPSRRQYTSKDAASK